MAKAPNILQLGIAPAAKRFNPQYCILRQQMTSNTMVVIEHCEKGVSEWLKLEYSHVSKVWKKNIMFTSVTDDTDAQALRPLGRVKPKGAGEALKGAKAIILDPESDEPLSPEDFKDLDALVIGGILGYEQRRGRTKSLITDKYKLPTRTLGKIQLSIDGAAFVARAVMLGLPLSDIEIANEIEIEHGGGHSTVLPFGYPVIGNNVIITPGLTEYLQREEAE